MYKISEGQSVLDVAVQKCGSAEAAFALAQANGISLTEDLAAGIELDLIPPADRNMANYYANKNLSPATGITSENELIAEGIEFWEIEYDFVVS